MTPDAELNSEHAPEAAAADAGGEIREAAAAGPPEAAVEAVAPKDGAGETGALDDDLSKPSALQKTEPSGEAEAKPPTGEAAHAPASAAAIPPVGEAPAPALGDALSALDRRDYATAKRLFAALGRKDAAEAIDEALAALDRKDFPAAQALFEALAPPKAATSATPAPPDDDRPKAAAKDATRPATPAAEAAPGIVAAVDSADRRPAPPAEPAKKRRVRPLLVAALLALIAIVGASAYVAERGKTFVAAGGQAASGPAFFVDVARALMKGFAGPGGSEAERSQLGDVKTTLAGTTARLDRIERDAGARLDALDARLDHDIAAKLQEMSARLDALEKTAAAPAGPSAELGEALARVGKLEKKVAAASQPSSELADLTARLDRLEKRAAASAATPAPPALARRPAQSGRPQALAAGEPILPAARRPLLPDYSVEDVQNGMAVVGSRYGMQQVAPGDYIPGAGQVLRIERRGGDWLVVTNRGVIASAPSPY